MNDLLAERVRRQPPRSQREGAALTVRQSIAAFGEAAPGDIRAVCVALAQGLFGPAFDNAVQEQRLIWIDLMECEYRRAIAGMRRGQAFGSF